MSNILSEVHPELIAEWSDKNLPLTPDRITYGSNKVVWWKGACGHECIRRKNGFTSRKQSASYGNEFAKTVCQDDRERWRRK